MADIIQVLPDSVANQIAAGEVIQRPASVVKELVENAIDAGATEITVNLKDAGRTLVQVIDNGSGMSPTDARMSFERHATSKIREANDLFAIRTMGFRGEALASIASIADVELRTRKRGEELGSYIHILGAVFQKQQPDSCPEGCNFLVKNLFFNVPARRKFLKSNSTELKHIITEIQRVALANPELAISLFHNGSPIYELPSESRRKRIVSLFGKAINQSLIPVQTETSVINISGFIGQPRFARKMPGEQFFFVNNRFMKHPFFHKAVIQAYERILPPETFPSYFLYFEVDPSTIDINIHPTKTEIKFEDERAAWQIIMAALRESIGKFNLMPSIDFDQTGAIDIPLAPVTHDDVLQPEVRINPAYNPFDQIPDGFAQSYNSPRESANQNHWEKLYLGLEQPRLSPDFRETDNWEEPDEAVQQTITHENGHQVEPYNFLQLKNRYIITPVKSGLMLIDQRRAHERILFEHFMQILDSSVTISQRVLFPEELELNAADAEVLQAINSDLKQFGFEIRQSSANIFFIEGIPGPLSHLNGRNLVEKLLEAFKSRPVDVVDEMREHLAAILAQTSAIDYGIALKPDEISSLFNNLFACQMPNFSPSGKKIVSIIALQDLEKLIK